jgi:hypothetical protein
MKPGEVIGFEFVFQKDEFRTRLLDILTIDVGLAL